MIAGLDRQVTPGVAQHDRLMEIDQGFEGRIMGMSTTSPPAASTARRARTMAARRRPIGRDRG